MKPMNSRRLNDVFDKLAKIGQKKIKKSESLFASINLQDEMIKIASKQVVLDPIETKLRTGYVRAISKERPYMVKMGTQFTHLPETEELKKEKKRTPSSAPSKYPSGSETTAPYVGEQHGGDQVPAASTLAKQASSKALKEVIRELQHEDQIFVDVSQVIMRLNQKGQQTSVNMDDICKTLADNGITLIKKAEMVVESASIADIRERLNSARDSRSYHVDMLQEKDLEDGQKEKHTKSKKKWEKEINRLDREYAKAVRVQRKEERDEAKAEKAEKAEQQIQEQQQEPVMAGIKKKADIEGDGISSPAEIAESFVNGNISWVREQIAGDIKKFNDVLTELENMNPSSVESFRRTMTAGVKGLKKKADSQYQAGDRVELVRHTDVYSKLTPGEQGTVNSIDDTGTVHITWDNGETLGMVPDAGDEIKLITADASDVSASTNSGRVVLAEEPITMDEPLMEPSFELEQFLSPSEYQEMQRLLDLRQKAWHQIAEREERNLQEGLEPYANIDYSEVELYNDKIQQYQEVSKGRKGQNVMPESPEADAPMGDMGIPDMPPMPEGGEEGGEEMGDKGVLDKRPLPEFASAKNKLTKKADKIKDDEGLEKRCGECGWEFYTTYGTGECPECGSTDWEGKLRGTDPKSKKASTSQDIPHVCKNCKALVVPSGYNMLSFLDHKTKPFCTIGDGEKRIGFRYAYARECRGYDGIMKEMTQKVDTPSEFIFEEMKDNGVKSVLERKAGLRRKAKGEDKSIAQKLMDGDFGIFDSLGFQSGGEIYQDVEKQTAYLQAVNEMVKEKVPATVYDLLEEENHHALNDALNKLDKFEPNLNLELFHFQDTPMPEVDGNQHGMKRKAEYEDNPKNEPATIDTKEDAEARGKKVCEKCMQYFIPRGQKHMTQDWHELWDVPYTDVSHCQKGACIPRSMAHQSNPDSGVNQFDTISNRVVEAKKKVKVASDKAQQIIDGIRAGTDKYFGMGHFHTSNMADYSLMSNTISDMTSVYGIDEVEAGDIIQALTHN